jgi:hypothetical protein
MPVCTRCAGIDLDTMGIYVLSDMATTLKSSEDCSGCDFVIKVARRENLFVVEKPKAKLCFNGISRTRIAWTCSF